MVAYELRGVRFDGRVGWEIWPAGKAGREEAVHVEVGIGVARTARAGMAREAGCEEGVHVEIRSGSRSRGRHLVAAVAARLSLGQAVPEDCGGRARATE